MALADRTRQSGDAATRWPITILLSNGSVLATALPRRRFAALPRPVCQSHKARIRIEIEIEIELEFNQSDESKPFLCLVNFTLISQIQSQSQSLI